MFGFQAISQPDGFLIPIKNQGDVRLLIFYFECFEIENPHGGKWAVMGPVDNFAIKIGLDKIEFLGAGYCFQIGKIQSQLPDTN